MKGTEGVPNKVASRWRYIVDSEFEIPQIQEFLEDWPVSKGDSRCF